eukprot:scaffold54977_cov48-Prasinocladus_malaysianus.AAC.2
MKVFDAPPPVAELPFSKPTSAKGKHLAAKYGSAPVELDEKLLTALKVRLLTHIIGTRARHIQPVIVDSYA